MNTIKCPKNKNTESPPTLRRGGIIAAFLTMLTTWGVLAGAEEKAMTRLVEIHLGSPQGRGTEAVFSKHVPVQHTATVISQTLTSEPVPRQRDQRLSPQHLVILGIDAQGAETSRIVMLDPRLVRAETSDETGHFISKGMLYRDDVTFSIAIPHDPRTVSLRFHKPRWTGEAFELDPVGAVTLPQRQND